ncbi:hypothetical protein M405DRAFT_804057 [Rhizopogon salebrosus TDB-379]|nr:hypothetical protein M405DRAFT_804057 [Rhizopogon salebrosus TDB-379]
MHICIPLTCLWVFVPSFTLCFGWVLIFPCGVIRGLALSAYMHLFHVLSPSSALRFTS